MELDVLGQLLRDNDLTELKSIKKEDLKSLFPKIDTRFFGHCAITMNAITSDWFVATFNIEKPITNLPFHMAYRNGNIEFMEWYLEKYGFTPDSNMFAVAATVCRNTPNLDKNVSLLTLLSKFGVIQHYRIHLLSTAAVESYIIVTKGNLTPNYHKIVVKYLMQNCTFTKDELNKIDFLPEGESTEGYT